MNAKEIEQAIIDLEDFEVNDKVVFEDHEKTVLGLVVGFTLARHASGVYVIVQSFTTTTGPRFVLHPHTLRNLSNEKRLAIINSQGVTK